MADPSPAVRKPRASAPRAAAPAVAPAAAPLPPPPPPAPVMAYDAPPGDAGEPEPSPWRGPLERLGFNLATVAGFGLGVLLLLVAKLLETVLATSQFSGGRTNSQTGLLQTTVWIGFVGSILVCVSLLVAALLARRAHWGARLGLLVLGLSALGSGSVSALAALFGRGF